MQHICKTGNSPEFHSKTQNKLKAFLQNNTLSKDWATFSPLCQHNAINASLSPNDLIWLKHIILVLWRFFNPTNFAFHWNACMYQGEAEANLYTCIQITTARQKFIRWVILNLYEIKMFRFTVKNRYILAIKVTEKYFLLSVTDKTRLKHYMPWQMSTVWQDNFHWEWFPICAQKKAHQLYPVSLLTL